MTCSSCDRPIKDDEVICERCLIVARVGFYGVCVRCDKVAFAAKVKGGNDRRRVYTIGCFHCRQPVPTDQKICWSREEDAINRLQQLEDLNGKFIG